MFANKYEIKVQLFVENKSTIVHRVKKIGSLFILFMIDKDQVFQLILGCPNRQEIPCHRFVTNC